MVEAAPDAPPPPAGAAARRLVGLVPAAGRARRLGNLPGSKELLPVGFGTDPGAPRPRPVCEYLLESLHLAAVAETYVVIAPGKWDIPAYLGDGTRFGLRIAYLVADSPNPAATVDAAHPFVRDATVAFGFPDIVAEPVDFLRHVLDQLEAREADVALALFPADRPDKCDLVELDPSGQVRSLAIKPGRGNGMTWAAATWKPSFTEYLHAALETAELSGEGLHLGEVLAAGLRAGLRIVGVAFPEGWYIDVGTPDDLRRAMRRLS